MTAGELIKALQEVPEETDVVIFMNLDNCGTYISASVKQDRMFKTVNGFYSKFWREENQHRNDTKVMVIK